MTNTYPQSFGAEVIAQLLMHRYPLLLVDRVVSWEANACINAIKNVTVNEPHFPGHFPQRPIMPGVLIIEALAQASGLLARLSAESSEQAQKYLYLAGIDKARFKRLVVPGDVLELEVTVIQRRANIARLAAVATVSGELAAKAELISAQED